MNIDRLIYNNKEKEEINEILIKNVDAVHIERMNDTHVWIAFYSGDEKIIINYHSKENGKIFGYIEQNK